MTRLLLLSDIHGDELFLSHILAEGRRTGVDGVLVCGDLGADRAWPVHPEADERDRAFFTKRGFMPFEIEGDVFDRFSERFNAFLDMEASADDIAFIESIFAKGAAALAGSGFPDRSFSTILAQIERFCSDVQIPCMAVTGSADIADATAQMRAADSRTDEFHFIHGASGTINDLAVIGLGKVVASEDTASVETLFTHTPTSFFAVHQRSRPHTKRPAAGNEITEKEAHLLLARGQRAAGNSPTVILSHTPPFASGADLLVSKEGQVLATGSSEVRRFATHDGTVLVHTGHIHACSGVTRIGQTPVVNSGQLAGLEQPLYNVRNIVDEVATTYVPVAIWEPVGGMAAIAEIDPGDRSVRASPIIVTQHVEDA